MKVILGRHWLNIFSSHKMLAIPSRPKLVITKGQINLTFT